MNDAVGNVKIKPEPYDLSDPQEVLRLYRECQGYLKTCRSKHHGTDMQGRAYAIAALEELMEKTGLLRALGARQRRRRLTSPQGSPP